MDFLRGAMVKIENLSVEYGGGNCALKDVSLEIKEGESVALLGANGAGKSTTIRLILDMVQRDGGTVTILGRDSRTASVRTKEEIGVVLGSEGIPLCLNAVQAGKVMAGIYRNWDAGDYTAFCRKFDLPPDKKYKDYSAGMQRKLCIAVALSHHAKLLLLDEATNGLDPVVRDEILDEFLAFIQEETHAILISSHITSDLEKVADYVTYLHKGKVAVQGAKDELLDTYGRLVCARSDLAAVDPALLAGKRVSQFGCEALIKDRRAFCRRYPQLTVDPVTLEEIMLFTVKGDASCAD